MHLPIPQERIQQFMVQFACRIPTRGPLTTAEKRALRETLTNSTTIDEPIRDLFQMFSDDEEKSQNLFQVDKQYMVENMTVTVPAFVLSNNSITLVHPIKIGPKVFVGRDLSSNHLNTYMRNVLAEVQKVLPRITFNRAGKIFEFLFGPFPSAEREHVLRNMFSLNMSDVSEINLQFTPIKRVDNQDFNFQTRFSVQFPSPNEFLIALRVDINNRALRDSLEPTLVHNIWNQGDARIEGYVQELIPSVV